VSDLSTKTHVVIVGGGFAGLACARELAKSDQVRVTLIDKNNFHQFTPLLYQVATAELGTSDIRRLRELAVHWPRVNLEQPAAWASTRRSCP